MKIVDLVKESNAAGSITYRSSIIDDLEEQLNAGLDRLTQENEDINATYKKENGDLNANHKEKMKNLEKDYNKKLEDLEMNYKMQKAKLVSENKRLNFKFQSSHNIEVTKLKNNNDQANENHKNLIDKLHGQQEDLNKRYEDIIRRQHALAKQNGGDNVNPAEIINLSIRGTDMFARRDTLTAVKGSRLEVLFSGRWENQIIRDEDGRVFIDADPDCFKKVLEFLYKVKSTSASSAPPLPPFPTRFDNERQEKVFDVYVKDYFALCSEKEADSTVETDVNQNDPKPHELLRLMETELGIIEKDLAADESFIAALTYASPNICNELEAVSNESSTADTDDTEKEEHKDEEEVSLTSDGALLVETFSIDTPSVTTIGTRAASALTNLYVNGEIITYKTSTIFAEPSFKLAQQLSDEAWCGENRFVTKEGKVCYLIEQPVGVFKEVMTYLHLRSIAGSFLSKSRNVPLPVFGSNEVQEENEFMCMMTYFFGDNNAIFESLKYGSLFDSEIVITAAEMKQIMEWLPSSKKSSKPELLYRASRDGWTTKDFHDKCDYKGATIVVVKSSEGYVFGGYTDVTWKSSPSCRYKHSRESFLFGLKCQTDIGPVKVEIKNENVGHAVYHNRTCCVSFGNGPDLHIVPNANQCANSYARIGNTYQLPNGADGDKGLVTDRFKVTDWEVFHV